MNNILETIGNTPMVKMNKIVVNPNVAIYAKLEGFNPSGSIKDRVALKMIEQAEKEGILTKDKIIIEATSGNTGIGLAMVGAVKGYRVQIVLSEAVSIERVKVMQALGAEVILTPANLGTDGAIRKTRELLEENPDTYFNPDQFSNRNNKLAHYETTAQEIWEQTEGKITHLVASIGTTGTIMGIAEGLREKNPDIKIVEAHPEKDHRIQGLKNMEEAIVPTLYDKSKIDDSIMIKSEEAFTMARRIIKEEGILIGMSSGAAMVAACEVAKKIEKGYIVTIFPDRVEKYLTTELFNT